MKHAYKYVLSSIMIVAFTLGSVNAQDLGAIGQAANEDATKYLGSYFEPIIVSTSNGLANGWNNTAKPHKLFGFDLTATVSVAGIPDSDYSFLFKNEDYNSIELTNGTEAQLPTLAGGDPEGGIQLQIVEPTTGVPTGQTLDPLSGIGLDDIPVIRAGVPVPMANIGVGLPKNTELRVRFIPVSNIGSDVSVNGSFGVGVLHDIKQWIPGMKLVPIDIAGFVGYNQFKFSYEDSDGNKSDFTSKATTFQVLASKKLLFFTPFVGVGFNAINSDFSFEVSDPNNPSNTAEGSFEYDKLGGARFTIGGRLKILWVLSLNVDYTFQKYNTTTVGFGINIR